MSRQNRNSWRVRLTTELGTLAVLATWVLAVRADVPHGWFLAGSKPFEFEAGVDPDQGYQSHRSAYLKSKPTCARGAHAWHLLYCFEIPWRAVCCAARACRDAVTTGVMPRSYS